MLQYVCTYIYIYTDTHVYMHICMANCDVHFVRSMTECLASPKTQVPSRLGERYIVGLTYILLVAVTVMYMLVGCQATNVEVL